MFRSIIDPPGTMDGSPRQYQRTLFPRAIRPLAPFSVQGVEILVVICSQVVREAGDLQAVVASGGLLRGFRRRSGRRFRRRSRRRAGVVRILTILNIDRRRRGGRLVVAFALVFPISSSATSHIAFFTPAKGFIIKTDSKFFSSSVPRQPTISFATVDPAFFVPMTVGIPPPLAVQAAHPKVSVRFLAGHAADFQAVFTRSLDHRISIAVARSTYIVRTLV
mmetsp:Transcript_1131/g.2191  ORF Transcript_1131/g.2191 Transcript_1131/m.2191 type:complete len:221 (+) Transcript_1131:208-870(+)